MEMKSNSSIIGIHLYRKKMKICTFNVNSIKARKDLILDWLAHRRNDIDILCLQELKQISENFPEQEFKNLGYYSEVYGQKTYNGVAICSKFPLTDVHFGFGEDSWDKESRIISAKFENISIINIYAPHGDLPGTEKFEYKQSWYTKLFEHLSVNYVFTDPLVIVGDFNVARTDNDVYSPEELVDTIGTLPEERKAFENLLNLGLYDTFRHVYPKKKQFTWWSYLGGAFWKDQGMRIDYILIGEKMLSKVKSIEVDLWPRKRKKPTPSDHAPLIAEFSL